MSEATRPTTAVLIMGFGGPDSLDAIGPFMTNLMGREPSEELLEAVKLRYLAIGGASPLPETAASMAKSLEGKLAEMGSPVPVAIGMRYWHPFIGDVLAGMHEWGIRRVVAVSLSPFDSEVSTGAYREALDHARSQHPDLEIVEAPALHTLHAFRGLLVTGVVEALTELKEYKPMLAVFTAHSLPSDRCTIDDPYVRQVRSIIDGITESLGMPVGEELDGSGETLKGIQGYGNLRDPQPWVFAYQSRGERDCEWLGPDLDAVVGAAIEGGFKSIAVCPVGFVTDHMETLYDLDVVVADRLLKAEREFARAPVPNDDPILVTGIAEAVQPLLAGSELADGEGTVE